MDRNRSLLVVTGSFALLAAGVALTVLLRKQDNETAEKLDEAIQEVDKALEVKPKPKSVKKVAKVTAAKNGHVASAN